MVHQSLNSQVVIQSHSPVLLGKGEVHEDHIMDLFQVELVFIKQRIQQGMSGVQPTTYWH